MNTIRFSGAKISFHFDCNIAVMLPCNLQKTKIKKCHWRCFTGNKLERTIMHCCKRITKDTASDQRLLTVHKIDKKYFFEIPAKYLDKDMLFDCLKRVETILWQF